MTDEHHAAPRPFPPVVTFAPAVLTVLAVTIGGPPVARAYEDQVTLSAAAGYSLAPNSSLPKHGVGGGISASVGLGDVLSLRGQVGYAYHPGSTTLSVFSGSVELLYLVDILELVPYFGVGLGGLGSLSDGAFGGDPAVDGTAGVDWVLSRDYLLGLDIRAYVLPLALGDAGLDPVYLTASVRFSLVFDTY